MKITKATFTQQDVILDFHEYEFCTFTNCKFILLGYSPFALNECEVTNCEFNFAGPAASTIQTMSNLYNSFGEQGKNLVEGVFDKIRSGNTQ